MLGHRQPPQTMLQQVRDRQLLGGPVHRRPFVAEFSVEGACSGTVTNNPGGMGTPAFAAQYSKFYNDGKLLAVADEEGFVSIVDTSCELPTEMADDWGPNKPRAQWMAHRNAVFDLSWCNDDMRMLTASGDQTISLWDTGHADLLASFKGHSGSVKTVCAMPASNDVFASGARDGAIMVWDARVPARADANSGEPFHSPVVTVQDAHALNDRQKRRRTPLQGRTRPSVTSLTFLQGASNQLATGGVDGIVKFWDLRQAAGGATAAAAPAWDLARLCDASVPHISQKQHGITSLALQPQGSQLLVSLTGGHHFVYDPLRPHIGPTRWFGGHTVASFYVKAAWSPDGSHIISGSTDRSVYIWEVDAPDGASPYVLPGHQGEVTAVAWCPSDFQQIATTADDATVKVWHIQRQQPEEQADGNQAQDAWQPWWRQASQVQAAAAAAAAYQGVGQEAPPGSATPGTALGSATAAAAAAGLGAATPWSAPGLGGSSSASMLAALRTQGGGAGPSAGPHGATPTVEAGQQDENAHANRRPQQGAAGPAEQQQQTGGSRLAPFMTPFAPAGSTPAGAGSPAAGTRTVRRIGDLLNNPAPSTRRTTKQRSIASFLRSPAAAAAGGAAAGPSAGQSTVRKGGARSRRDLPDASGGGRPAGDRSAAAPSSAGKRGSPLPGLAGSALPSPPSAKRLRTTFEAAGTGKDGPAAAAAVAAAARLAGAAAAALEPSPEQALGSSAAAKAAAEAPGAAAMKRQGSSRENQLDLCNV